MSDFLHGWGFAWHSLLGISGWSDSDSECKMRLENKLLLHGKQMGSAQAQEAPSSAVSRKKALPVLRGARLTPRNSPYEQTSGSLAVSGRDLC